MLRSAYFIMTQFLIPFEMRNLKSAIFVISIIGLLLALCPLQADVVRPAPDFIWKNASGAAESLKNFYGQPIILLIATSPRNRAFRSQVGQLNQVYERLGAAKAVCVAAFTQDVGRVRSDIPFVIAADGPRVAFQYDVTEDFAVGVIGVDGNLDCITTRVLSGERILDLIDNSFALQQRLRRN